MSAGAKARVPWYLSISTRLLSATALLIAVVVGAVLWQWKESAEDLIEQQAHDEGRAVAETLALSLTSFVADENWNQARVGIDFLLQRNADFVYVIVSDERQPQIALAFPQDQEKRFITDLVPAAVTHAALKEGDTRFADTYLLHDVATTTRVAKRGERIVEVAQDLRFSTGRFGVVRVGVSMKRAEQALAATIREAVIGVAVSLFLALVVASVVSRRVTRPIVVLANLMERVGEGKLDEEAKVTGRHEVSVLGKAFNHMLIGLRQKRVLEKYVPMGARRDIAGESSGRIELGGSRRRCAILFSDLRGFTSMSERLPPQEVVALLNEYLEKMTHCIGRNGGDINEYIGDAILAVFRCDGDMPEGQKGALAAVRAAWDMQAALRDLELRTSNEEVKKLVMGIGIHVGDVVEGNIGSFERVKYGVVGDTVNLAARIQDRSRDGKHTRIFISDDARADVGPHFDAISHGEIQFKGKSKPVTVWEITEPAKTKSS